jgi:MYXO-CTERM domain-containing protein
MRGSLVAVISAAFAAASSPAAVATAVPTAPKSVPIAGRCVVAGGVALLLPHNRPLALGAVATAPKREVAAGAGAAYPADGSVASFSGLEVATGACARGEGIGASVSVSSLSLLGGAVTADTVGLRHGRVALVGLAIGGVAARMPKKPVRLGSWGRLSVDATTPYAHRLRTSALTVTLVRPYLGLPARAEILVGFVDIAHQPPKAETWRRAAPRRSEPRRAAPARQVAKAGRQVRHRGAKHVRRRRHAAPRHEPLKVTPSLGLSGYVSPVVGHVGFSDTYGAFRSDVSGGWHHGDDIFAPLGTPVVAVASGTLNRVGWESLGGWRLWVRDRRGNEFYYAHLSGYTPLALRSSRVQAGDVLGFVGNTGDAITTPPHLHFEIHPRTLLRLRYDGAVDPTTYLRHWRHLDHVRAPKPVHPAVPTDVRGEARRVFRELLAARGLISRAALAENPRPRRPRAGLDAARRATAKSRSDAGDGVTPSLLSGGLALLGIAALALVQRRRP